LPITGNLTAGQADRLSDRVDPSGLDPDGELVTLGAVHRTIVSEIDEGDDLGISNGELNRVRSELAALDDDGVRLLVGQWSDEQLHRVFHNVHSSGFWSNDWDDRERTEFYRLLEPLSPEAKIDVGRFSPYLEAWGEAELATRSDGTATAALADLVDAEPFSHHLDYGERTALLWQVANHPAPAAITNLERLAGKDWFRDADLEDVQRSAKIVAHVSVHGTGDRSVLDNTLDLFLADDAPYRFDWEQNGGAYGSAGGDEFHFNRAHLDAGNGSVADSVPSGGSERDTEHMATHTVAHEVNHLVNGDRVAQSYEYFMGEYRAYWVGHVAQYGTPPSRAEVEARVRYLLTAPSRAYARIAAAVDDPVEGPLIAAFVEGVVGRPVTAETVVDEITAGVTDPDEPAPVPVPVDGGPNSLDNAPPEAIG
jgi:hypothetical protein